MTKPDSVAYRCGLDFLFAKEKNEMAIDTEYKAWLSQIRGVNIRITYWKKYQNGIHPL